MLRAAGGGFLAFHAWLRTLIQLPGRVLLAGAKEDGATTMLLAEAPLQMDRGVWPGAQQAKGQLDKAIFLSPALARAPPAAAQQGKPGAVPPTNAIMQARSPSK